MKKIILLTILVLAGCKEQRVSKDHIMLDKLDAKIFMNGWHFSDDSRILGKTKQFVRESDATTAVKVAMDEVGLHFFLFEEPLGTPVEFNSNISFMTEDISLMPGVRDISDYFKGFKIQLERNMQNVKILKEEYKLLNDFDVGIIEVTNEQKLGNRMTGIHNIFMATKKGRIIYVFTATALKNEMKRKRSAIEKILFSLKKIS